MRARSLLQRFPVRKWVHDLEVLQTQSIQAHNNVKRGPKLDLMLPRLSLSTECPIRFPQPVGTRANSILTTGNNTLNSPSLTTINIADSSAFPSRAPSRASRASSQPGSRAPSPARTLNGHRRAPSVATFSTFSVPDSVEANSEPSSPTIPARFAWLRPSSGMVRLLDTSRTDDLGDPEKKKQTQDLQPRTEPRYDTEEIIGRDDESLCEQPLPSDPASSLTLCQRQSSGQTSLAGTIRRHHQPALRLDTVVGDCKDFELHKVEPFFSDPKGEYYNAFGKLLDSHQGSLSSDKLCVEEYIRTSEKDWFSRFYDTKLGKRRYSTVNTSCRSSRSSSINSHDDSIINEFNLAADYKPPTGLKNIMLAKIGDWPVYAFLMAFVSCLPT